MFLYQVLDSLNSAKLKYAVVGGYALALHGLVRATMDVDLVLCLKQEDFVKAEQALSALGLRSRLPLKAEEVIQMRQEYIERRNLLAWSFVDFKNPTRQVDILITEDFRRLKTQMVSVGGRKVIVATLKELIRMKESSGRPQDLVDIENMKRVLNEKG